MIEMVLLEAGRISPVVADGLPEFGRGRRVSRVAAHWIEMRGWA